MLVLMAKGLGVWLVQGVGQTDRACGLKPVPLHTLHLTLGMMAVPVRLQTHQPGLHDTPTPRREGRAHL